MSWTPVPGHPDVGMPFNGQPIMPARQSPSSSTVQMPTGSGSRLPVPRMPGVTQPARLPPEMRQEYEAYVQNRLRMRQAHPPRAVIVQGVIFCRVLDCTYSGCAWRGEIDARRMTGYF